MSDSPHTSITIQDKELAERFRAIRDKEQFSSDGFLEKLLDNWEESTN